MKIQPVFKKTQTSNPSFAYKHALKTAFDRGLMPEVKKGLLGHPINKQTRSIEHLTPKSLGGGLTWDNVALSERTANTQRGVKPIEELVTYQMWVDYLKQFVNVKNKLVNGMDYIKGLCKRFNIKLEDVTNV